MIQTLASRKSEEAAVISKADYIVVDEAHHAVADSYKKTLVDGSGPDTRFVGVTATPFRQDGKGLAGFAFDAIVSGPSVTELIAQGSLAALGKLVMPDFEGGRIDTEGMTINKFGDFDTKELSSAARLKTASIVKLYLEQAEDRSTIFFAVDVEHSKELQRALTEAGVKAAHIDGTTKPEERAAIMERFRTGEVSALCNCMIAIEGFDAPSCSCVVLARPTKSRGLYMQMVGRGLRVAEGKTDCSIIDCSGCVLAFGSVEDEYEVTLKDGYKPTEVLTAGFAYPERETDGPHYQSEDTRTAMKSFEEFQRLSLVITREKGTDQKGTDKKGTDKSKSSNKLESSRYSLAGEVGGYDFGGCEFETDLGFSPLAGVPLKGGDSFAIGMYVAKSKRHESSAAGKPFDAVMTNGKLAASLGGERGSAIEWNVHRFLGDFVGRVLADAEKSVVFDHFKDLLAIQQSRKHKKGFVWYKLNDTWGKELVKELEYDYKKWSKEGGRGGIGGKGAKFKVHTLPNGWGKEGVSQQAPEGDKKGGKGIEKGDKKGDKGVKKGAKEFKKGGWAGASKLTSYRSVVARLASLSGVGSLS